MQYTTNTSTNTNANINNHCFTYIQYFVSKIYIIYVNNSVKYQQYFSIAYIITTTTKSQKIIKFYVARNILTFQEQKKKKNRINGLILYVLVEHNVPRLILC